MSNTIETDLFGFSNNAHSINSKRKGCTNERDCAKSLEEWTGVKFVRVPQSGGLRRQDTDKTVGDIIPDTLDKTFKFSFSVETKHLKTIHVTPILRCSSHIFKIWNQAMSDAIRSHKLPMALVRSNGMNKGEYYFILAASLGGTLMSMQVPVLFRGSNETHSIIGFMFSDVKKYLPYKKFARVVEQSNFVVKSKLYILK